MPTALDRAMQSKSAFWGFAGIVGAVAAWQVWGNSEIFPKQPETKGEPESWTDDELLRWLRDRNLMPTGKETREELIARVKANMRAPR